MRLLTRVDRHVPPTIGQSCIIHEDAKIIRGLDHLDVTLA